MQQSKRVLKYMLAEKVTVLSSWSFRFACRSIVYANSKGSDQIVNVQTSLSLCSSHAHICMSPYLWFKFLLFVTVCEIYCLVWLIVLSRSYFKDVYVYMVVCMTIFTNVGIEWFLPLVLVSLLLSVCAGNKTLCFCIFTRLLAC